jgi:hypothetical protein
MAEQRVLNTQAVQGYLIQPTNDGKQIAVVFRTKSGLTGYALSQADFGIFATKVLEMVDAEKLPASELANGVPTKAFPVEGLTFEPDPANASAVTVATRLGRLRLSLSLETSTLLQSFKQFLDRRRASRP